MGFVLEKSEKLTDLKDKVFLNKYHCLSFIFNYQSQLTPT